MAEMPWVVQDLNADGQPNYGPFATEEAADAFGAFFETMGIEWCAFPLHDPAAHIERFASAANAAKAALDG
jgi:hypothetical protein